MLTTREQEEICSNQLETPPASQHVAVQLSTQKPNRAQSLSINTQWEFIKSLSIDFAPCAYTISILLVFGTFHLPDSQQNPTRTSPPFNRKSAELIKEIDEQLISIHGWSCEITCSTMRVCQNSTEMIKFAKPNCHHIRDLAWWEVAHDAMVRAEREIRTWHFPERRRLNIHPWNRTNLWMSTSQLALPHFVEPFPTCKSSSSRASLID